MMHNNLEPRDAGHIEPATSRPNVEQAAMADREVEVAGAHMSDAMHAWLDGESVSDAKLMAAGKEYEFWKQIQGETTSRRSMKTPMHLAVQIMSGIAKS